MKRTLVRRWLVPLCCVIGLGLSSIHAETPVDVSLGDEPPRQRLIRQILSIIDDVDPIGSMLWGPFDTRAVSRVLLDAMGAQMDDLPEGTALTTRSSETRNKARKGPAAARP